MQNNEMQACQRYAEYWRIILIDTGKEAMTGGRLKLVAPYLTSDEPCCFTYANGVAKIFAL
jgi:glucose-1-phosphate cytidylyltransferase